MVVVDELPDGATVVELELPRLPGAVVVLVWDCEPTGPPGTGDGVTVVLLLVEPLDGVVTVVDELPAAAGGAAGSMVVVIDVPAEPAGVLVVVVVVDCARAGMARVRPSAAVAESRAVRIVISIAVAGRPETAGRAGRFRTESVQRTAIAQQGEPHGAQHEGEQRPGPGFGYYRNVTVSMSFSTRGRSLG